MRLTQKLFNYFVDYVCLSVCECESAKKKKLIKCPNTILRDEK